MRPSTRRRVPKAPSPLPSPPTRQGPQPPGSAGYAADEVTHRELRPRRAWYWLAGALALVSTVVAAAQVGLLVGDIVLPRIDSFPSGETAVVTLEAGGDDGIYVLARPDGTAPELDCSASAMDGGTIELGRPTLDWSVVDGGEVWYLEHTLEVGRTGRYRLTCHTRPDAALGDAFGVGSVIDLGGAARQSLVSTAVMYGGLGAAMVICLVVALRRSSHRTRLLAARRPPAAPTLADHGDPFGREGGAGHGGIAGDR
jgi:hypothetical protein